MSIMNSPSAWILTFVIIAFAGLLTYSKMNDQSMTDTLNGLREFIGSLFGGGA